MIAGSDDHMRWLHVAMHDALGVRVPQDAEQPGEDPERVLCAQPVRVAPPEGV